jgi:hypothetical protein
LYHLTKINILVQKYLMVGANEVTAMRYLGETMV